MGVAKPHPGIFAHALAQLGDPPPAQVLMVGDNPQADIAGGLAAGLHTCWFNAHGAAAPEGVVPHHQVASLAQLQAWLLGAVAHRRCHRRRSPLELGGKSPAIVCADYPLDQAAARLATGKWFNAGQTCIAPDYVLIDAGREAALVQALRAQVLARYGDFASAEDYTRIVRTWTMRASAPSATADAGPTAPWTRPSPRSTAATGRWRCIPSAMTARGSRRSCMPPSPAGSPSTTACCISPPTRCRSAASAPAAWAPTTAAPASTPSARRCLGRRSSAVNVEVLRRSAAIPEARAPSSARKLCPRPRHREPHCTKSGRSPQSIPGSHPGNK
ncbi:aldehyde dehydrogenase family protein [Pantoea ananatis]|nr:aldehyde dehydrogenase family protein [Pantoea ananatis]